MGKKGKLAKIHKTASDNCYENMTILDSLISNSETCPAQCGTLLEMARKRNRKAFKKIEKSREILNITD
jgi:hypothetical protein